MTVTIRAKSGRKPLDITYEQIARLRQRPGRMTWSEVAQALGCSRATVIRIFKEGPKGA